MKQRLLSIAWVVLLGAVGCGDEGTFTDPLPLEGSWTGTVTYHSPPESEAVPCPAESVSVGFTQAGSALTGRFETACAGPLDLQGTVSGGDLTGTLVSVNGTPFGGRVSGTASADGVRISVTQSSRRTTFPILTISLAR